MVAALANVSRRYGEVCALDGLSFEVREGEAVALLGPNGAGKTTAIAVLLGMRRPDAGTATVLGEPALSMAARRLVGVIPQELSFPPTLTVREIVAFVAAHYPDPLSVDETLARFELSDVMPRQTGGLSGGHAAAAGHRARVRRAPALDLPRRAHHRARRRVAPDGVVGDRSCARRRRDAPAHDPLPGGGGVARVTGAGGQPRPADRGRHPERDQGDESARSASC